MKTILREHLPFGIHLGVYASRQEAILHLADPHATLHQVPDNLCRKKNKQHLLDYVKAQVVQGLFFDVYSALQKIREKTHHENT